MVGQDALAAAYDGNGNMTQRVEVVGGQSSTYLQGWDVENRLIAITNTASGQVTTYSYNASGQRVKRVDAGGTLVTLGAHFEQLRVGAAVTHTSYYYFGDQRVAMRQTNVGTGVSTVYWLHGDHLGSASLTTTSSGAVVPNSVTRYKPFGEIRYPSSGSSSLPTDRTFTGQRSEKASFAGSLMDYGARFYSPLLGRFLSADSLVPQPGDPQSLNRYSYVLGNPLKYTDPTGHSCRDPGASEDECQTSGGGGAGVGGYVSGGTGRVPPSSSQANIDGPFKRALRWICAKCAEFVDQLESSLSNSTRSGGGSFRPGYWKRYNEVINDSTVVEQCHDTACVAASGEMLAKAHGVSNVSQNNLVNTLSPKGEKNFVGNSSTLADELNKAGPDGGWQGGYLQEDPSIETVQQLSRNGAWAAEMKTQGSVNHMIVVDGIEGNMVRIRDPWQGSSYLMTTSDLLANLLGGVWHGN
ncbi:MAG: hypothetical protein M1546_21115 [Chloroflexi bacterium]|nr:hypothetical protein [Chloroflexota bacterium]